MTTPIHCARWLALLAALALPLGCDALLGLGEPPSSGAGATSTGDATSSGGGSTVSGTSSTTAGGEGDGGAGGGGPDAGSTSSSSTGGGAGGSDPDLTPCGECDDPACALCAEGTSRCLVRRTVIEGSDRVGEDAGSVINRFGRALVVTEQDLVFVRRVAGPPYARITVAPRDGSVPVDALGAELPSGIAGLAASEDGEVVLVTPHVTGAIDEPTLYTLDLATRVLAPVVGVQPPPLATVRTFGPGKSFIGAGRDTSDLYRIDLDGESCLLREAEIRGPAVDLLVEENGAAILQYVTPGRVQVFTGGLDCDGPPPAVSSLQLQQELTPHAGARLGVGLYVLGVQGGNGYVIRGEDNSVAAHPSMALHAEAGAVFVPREGGGLVRCSTDLTGCEPVATAEHVGQVGFFHRTAWGGYTVGMSADVSKDEAIVACLAEP